MNDPQRREELAQRVARQRQELAKRVDISARTRELSQSSSRNRIGRPLKRSRGLTLLIAIAATAVMLVCVVSAVGAVAGGRWIQDQLNDPSNVVQKYYSALHQQDYAQAYSYFSAAQKARISQSAFTDKYSSYDQLGIIEAYPIAKTEVHDTTAVITVNVTRRGMDATAEVQTLHLVKDGNDWYIDKIDLGGTIALPSPTA